MLPMMIDSGAFSNFTGTTKITLEDYMVFLRGILDKNPDSDITYVNMDVIGNAEASFANWQRMRENGFNPIPVYHPGSDPQFLLEYLKGGSEIVGLGGVAKVSKRREYLDGVWRNYLIDESGMPIHKIHGFGITGFELVSRYPWYSVDGTTALLRAANGAILFPKRVVNGVADFSAGLRAIPISPRNTLVSVHQAHFDTMSVGERKLIGEFLIDWGFTIDGLINEYGGKASSRKQRVLFNATMMAEFCNTLEWPRSVHPSVLQRKLQ